ncbi:hypothetical protein RJT34_08921 [Clitoria ternatea]|uniref:Uncharacterized protein n=1 Tax=Clitoria ternatea TaxID=43366 RepID=A0AAN9K7N1_CLITE
MYISGVTAIAVAKAKKLREKSKERCRENDTKNNVATNGKGKGITEAKGLISASKGNRRGTFTLFFFSLALLLYHSKASQPKHYITYQFETKGS